MEIFNILLNTIAGFVNNTFVGTLLAGTCLAFLGLRLYRKQKKLDMAFANRTRIHELATALLTHINVAVKDFIGQVSIHSGENGVVKVIFEKMNALDPNFYTKETSGRFNEYSKIITHDFNELSTPLALDLTNESKVKTLANSIPQITFLLSVTSSLSALDVRTLKEVLGMMTKASSDAGDVLKEIISTAE